MADFTVQIIENIKLNGVDRGSQVNKIISGINYTDNRILNTKEFIHLDDTILTRIQYNKDLKSSHSLLKRIYNRNLYKKIYESQNKSLQEVKDNFLDKYPDLKESDLHFVEMKFDFCNKNKSPFENIHFYNNQKIDISLDKIKSKLLISNHNENIIYVYKK